MKRLIFVLLVFGFVILDAQEQNFELSKIRFQGNRTLSRKELYSILVSRESPSKFWQALYKVSERLGDKPQYLDKIKVANDIVNLQNHYFDNGFFDVKIDTSIYYNYDDKKAVLTFLIDEGPPYSVEKVNFIGLERIPDSLRRISMNFSFLKVGGRYRRIDVEAEIQRILNLLYDNGYQNAYVEKAGIRVLVDSTKKSVSIFVPFDPDGRYLIEDIKISIERTGRMKVSEELVRRELEFKKGEFYSRSLILKSEANLSQTGLFENVRIDLEPTGVSDTINFVNVNVLVAPRNKHDIFPSIYFSDERNAFNVGVSLDYQNRNFLGGGRNLSSSTRLQIQSLSFKRAPSLGDTTTAGLIEANVRLNQPYLFGRSVPGEFSLALMIDKQKNYLLNIARNRVRIIHRPNGAYSGFLDWDIEGVNIKFRGTVDPKLEKLYQRQLNSILSITFQIDRTDDLIYPRSGYAHMISVEEGGFFPFLLGQMGLNVLPFSQYYKFGWLYRRFFGLNNSVFAFKFKLGIANEFYIKSSKKFELQPIPINRRFFAGGSASVRGWRVRELGNVSNPSLGGNVLIEANFENRMIFWRNFGGVIFIDLGNLWDDLRHIKLNQFAVAGGFGFRYLTFFGGLRFDFGFKVYDPGSPTKVIFKRTAGQILKGLVFHIGVGQTF